jgi:hypothetical protein
MNKNQFDGTTFKLISSDRPTVNPYAGLQVAGLVIGYFCSHETEVAKLMSQWERTTKNV